MGPIGRIFIFGEKYFKEFNLTETIKGHSKACRTICELNNGVIVSGSDDKTIKIKLWNNNYECAAILKGHKDYVIKA